MKLVGIQRKSDGEILMAIPIGTSYRLPPGVNTNDVQVVRITIPETTLETVNLDMSEDTKKLEKIANHFGMQMADFIQQAAVALGIPHCAACQMRKKILYKIHEIGWWKALKLIWKTVGKGDLSEDEKSLIK